MTIGTLRDDSAEAGFSLTAEGRGNWSWGKGPNNSGDGFGAEETLRKDRGGRVRPNRDGHRDRLVISN